MSISTHAASQRDQSKQDRPLPDQEPVLDQEVVATQTGGNSPRHFRSANWTKALSPTKVLSSTKASGPRTLLQWVGSVASWVVLGVVLLVVSIMVVVPRVAGAESYTVLTQSMEPGLPPGTLVVVKPVPENSPAENQVKIGDVITYQLRSGEPDVVTHRVVGIKVAQSASGSTDRTANASSGTEYVTQGDNNNAPDQAAAKAVQIRGVLWYSVPWVGYLNLLITGQWHMWLLSGAVGLLVAYSVFMLLSAWRDSRNSRRTQGGGLR